MTLWKKTGQTPLREIEIFGIPALFTDQDIPPDEQSPDMFYYELVSADGNAALLGTVLTLIPVEIPESGERDVYDSDLMLDTVGELLTPEEFAEKYLSPVNGPDLDERYRKRRLILFRFWRELWRKTPNTINRILPMTKSACKPPCWKSARKIVHFSG